MPQITQIFVATLFAILVSPLTPANSLIEVHLGNAWTAPADLTIEQEGHPDLSFSTGFETRGLSLPPYYSIRGGWQVEQCSYELEMIHHKLYARDLPAEVEHFEITHGLDFLFVNHSCPWWDHRVRWRLGAGMALANTYSIVRGEKFYESGGFTMPIVDEAGYYPTGPFVQLAMQKTFRYGISLETKWAGGWIDVPVVNGRATMWHQSVHFLVGYSWNR